MRKIIIITIIILLATIVYAATYTQTQLDALDMDTINLQKTTVGYYKLGDQAVKVVSVNGLEPVTGGYDVVRYTNQVWSRVPVSLYTKCKTVRDTNTCIEFMKIHLDIVDEYNIEPKYRERLKRYQTQIPEVTEPFD